MRLCLGVIDAEADEPRRRDPDDGGVECIARGTGGARCRRLLAMPRISRHLTRHGFRDAMSSTTNATFGLTAMLRYFWLFDMW